MCGGDIGESVLRTSCSNICSPVRLLAGHSRLELLGAGLPSGLGLRRNSPSAGLAIYF